MKMIFFICYSSIPERKLDLQKVKHEFLKRHLFLFLLSKRKSNLKQIIIFEDKIHSIMFHSKKLDI